VSSSKKSTPSVSRRASSDEISAGQRIGLAERASSPVRCPHAISPPPSLCGLMLDHPKRASTTPEMSEVMVNGPDGVYVERKRPTEMVVDVTRSAHGGVRTSADAADRKALPVGADRFRALRPNP
jgi:hypothetical protein